MISVAPNCFSSKSEIFSVVIMVCIIIITIIIIIVIIICTDLMRGGSLTMTRPSLVHYIASRQAYLDRARAVFDMIIAGQLKV